MNLRLLLALYDRSGLGAYMPVDYNGHELEVAEHMEKFAELIVRECIREIGYKRVELLDIDFYPHYQERLKKHFGVEE